MIGLVCASVLGVMAVLIILVPEPVRLVPVDPELVKFRVEHDGHS